MANFKLEGIVAAPVLPMLPDHSIDWVSLRSYIRWIADQKPTAIAMNMDASEGPALDRDEQLGMIDLNDRALVELTHIYWPTMMANKRGGVLNVASTAAFQPGPLMAIYYASKAFVLSFSEALWEEARDTGVKVSCLCPGPTVSKFRERAGTGKTRLSRTGSPMSSMSVARMGYDAWQDNRRVEITGLRNRLTASLVPFLPRTLLLRLVRNLQSPV